MACKSTSKALSSAALEAPSLEVDYLANLVVDYPYLEEHLVDQPFLVALLEDLLEDPLEDQNWQVDSYLMHLVACRVVEITYLVEHQVAFQEGLFDLMEAYQEEDFPYPVEDRPSLVVEDFPYLEEALPFLEVAFRSLEVVAFHFLVAAFHFLVAAFHSLEVVALQMVVVVKDFLLETQIC